MTLPKPLLSVIGVAAAWAAAPDVAAAPIELYEQPQFQGMALGLDRANPNLADYGFDNKALSIVVRSGTWELCTDAQYRGNCLVLGPGQHATLPAGLQRSLSSVRPKEGGPASDGGAEAQAAVVLYDDGDYSGKSLAVNGPIASLGKLNMGDRVSSVDVRRGVWQLCEDSNFQGSCIVLEPGRHHLTGGMHDEASSIRPLYGANRQPLPDAGGLTLFENSDFSGRSILITAPTEYLGRVGFGDMASAVEVHSGLWDVCTDSVYKGRCITLGPGRHVLSGNLHDRASSVRPRLPDNSPAWRGADPERRRIY
ncbi:beta/gamma crystallin-related protein [Ideonella sp. DXS29W]|uniref:Beta/gamma crystallin-related protein n=1 Tax=Ideonella lacteola TaxID=2984193 RepID=A0ABU9BMN7_9BURK